MRSAYFDAEPDAQAARRRARRVSRDTWHYHRAKSSLVVCLLGKNQ